jgi:hypothetical protein
MTTKELNEHLSRRIDFMRHLSCFYSEDVSKKDLKFIDKYATLPFGGDYSKLVSSKGIKILIKLCKKYGKFRSGKTLSQ